MPKYIYKKRADNKELEQVGILPSLTEWNGKSNVGHIHAISDIKGLQSKLDTIPSIKTLNTNNSSALPVSSSEAISGSGSINLHKVSKTGKFSDLNNRGEAFLSWGGQNFAGSYGPIDSAMIADLGANRLAFMPPAGISVEYSRDSGTTWQDYGATNAQKLALTSTGVNFSIGKADSSNKATETYMLRISLHTSDGKVYTQLNKFALYVSTNGSNGSYCTIRARTQNNYLNKVDKWDVFANKQSIAGWSGWNIINTSTITTYGNTASTQYGEIQLIFGCTSGSTSYSGLLIQRLMGFGGVGWTTPSNRAKYGTIYSYDYNQGVAFPGALTTNGTVNVRSGDLKLSSSGTIWCSQFNDASGISLRNSRGGATQIGTSQRGMHLCSGSQPEWWMNGAKKDTIAMKSDIGNGKITIQRNGTEVGSFTTNQSSGKTINISLAKSDVGLGNVDNTADKDKSVKYASSAGTATNLNDSNHSYTATDVYDYLRFKEQKIAYRAITQQCDFAVALADLTSKQHRNYGGSIYDKLYHQPGYVQLVVRLDDDAEPLPNKFSNPSIGGYSEIVALTLDISDMIPASSEVYPPNPYMFFLLKHITDVNGNSGFYGSSPIVSGPKGAYGNDTVTFNVDLWFPDSEWERKRGTATITCNATTSNIAGVYATKDELTDGLDTKANSSHTHSISQITNLQSTLNGKQAKLVSGTNIKTINGNSILGSGNISIASLLTEKQFSDIINATSSKSSYIIMDKLLIQWGVFIGAHGDTINWTVTYPKTFYWYPSVILQTKDTNTNNQGLPYSNGAVITNYNNGTSFTFQLRRSESCPVYWIAIGGLS